MNQKIVEIYFHEPHGGCFEEEEASVLLQKWHELLEMFGWNKKVKVERHHETRTVDL